MPRKKKAEIEQETEVKSETKSEIKKHESHNQSHNHKQASSQPEINVGMVGHVDHGKTTLVKALSGKWTDTHSEEIKRGITIRLGYADVNIYKCSKCEGPDAYGLKEKCEKCGGSSHLSRKISLVDAPGHESLMATMLCGANIMDGALLLVAANETCPQPQTQEHLMALEVTGVTNLIVVQNKVDLVSAERAKKNYEEIKAFLKGTKFENAPIVPISAMHNMNVDVLLYLIETLFKTPKRDTSKEPLMFVARSFDVNKPGTTIEKLSGGVIGGVLKQGVLKKGDEIEILPGYETEEKNKKVWKSLTTKIESVVTGGDTCDSVSPGGSFALLSQLDPSVVKSDKLVGSVVGLPGKLPKVWSELKLKITLLERVVGAKDKLVVEPIKPNEVLMLNVYSAATVGIVKAITTKEIACDLKKPVCADTGSKVTISRMVGQRWRLIGYGEIV